MLDDDSEIVTLLYGQEIDEEKAGQIVPFRGKYPDLDIEMHPGGQPLYYYIISVE